MPNRPITPPPRKPVSELLTPNHRDGWWTELVNRTDSEYQRVAPIPRGTLYSSMVGAKQEVIDAFPGGLFFLKETKPGNSADFGNSDAWVIWWWATEFLAESPSNAEISYLEESVPHPAFVRAYTIRRDVYEASPTLTAGGSPLTALLGVIITNGGSDYLTQPTAIIGVAGTGAEIEFVIAGGVIQSAIVTKEGSGHTAATTITITTGSGATAVAVLNGSGVAGVTVAPNANFLYDGPTIVSFNGIPTGFGAAGTPVFTPTGVNSVFVENGGSGFTAAAATITGGGGSGATATVNLVGDQVDSITVNTPGSGYTTAPTVTITGDGTGALARARLLTSIASVTLTNAGSAYITPAIVAFSQGPATATTTLITTSFSVASVTVTAAGGNYNAPIVTFSGGGGSGAAATANLSGTGIGSFTVTAGGSYTSVPSVAITNPGTGATATAIVQPVSAVLVSQKKFEFPADSPLNHEFVRVLRVYETLPGPILADREMSDTAQGAVVHSTKQRLATSAADLTPTWKTLAYADTPLDSNRKERNVVTMPDAAFPILTDYDQEPDTQSLITTIAQVVEAAAVVAPSIVNGQITRYKSINKWRSIKIIEIYSLPAGDFNEQRFMADSFPELFDYLKFSWTDACGTFYPNSASATNARDSFSAMVEAKLRTYYTTSVQAITGVTLIPKSLRFGHGQSFTNALVDAGTFTYTGTCTGTFSWTASSPSYTTYGSTYKNTFQIKSGESVRWKAGLYKNTELKIYML